jgi:hypothetical protein
MSDTLVRQWDNHSGYSSGYPADFGHMPVFDNTQTVVSGTYLNAVGSLPWGLLVFDYFTTLDPLADRNVDYEPDIDPLRVPGRININTAPWYVLSKLALLGPDSDYGELPVRTVPPGTAPTLADPSPSFWDPFVGVMVGAGAWDGVSYTTYRLLATETEAANPAGYTAGRDMPYRDADLQNPTDSSDLRYRLGPWLAQSAAAYRDGMQYVRYTGSVVVEDGFEVYAGSHLRNGAGQYRHVGGALWSDGTPYRMEVDLGGAQNLYGPIRGRLANDPDLTQPDRPDQFGLVTIGELLNVKGFDSSRHDELPPLATDWDGDSRTPDSTVLYRGDFVRAVSLLALIYSQYLTTRSNTFTVYASVMDRENPQASVRSQVTVDRSNLLPRLSYVYSGSDATWPLVPLVLDMKPIGAPDGVPETPVRTTNEGAEPRVIASEQVGYFNVRYDD